MAAYASLETEQLILHTRTVIIDIGTSLQGMMERLYQFQKYMNLLNKIHDNNLVKAVSNQVCNTACIYPGNVMKAGLCSSPFLSSFGTLFLLVRLVRLDFMMTSIAIWHSFSNNLHMGHSLQSLLHGGKGKTGLVLW